MVGDFLNLAPLPELGRGRRVGFFPGSTIGNLEPEQAVAFLANARERLGPNALFILGVDLVKDPAVLVAAYDDAQGVTAAFNQNLLVRANRELAADFDLDAFEHLAIWNAERVAHGDASARHAGDDGPTSARSPSTSPPARRSTPKARANSREASLTQMAEAAGWRVASFAQSSEPSVALAVLSN